MATIFGTSGAERIEGTSDDDKFNGYGGADTVHGLEGNDTISIYQLSDEVGLWKGFGQAGADHLTVHAPEFLLYGGAGDDDLRCWDNASGDSRMFGGGGNDYLQAAGIQHGLGLFGGAGNDRIIGTYNDDTIKGGWGHDDLNGDQGNDVIKGGGHGDLIHGGYGQDLIWGGRGADTLYGNDDVGERDKIHGNAGHDTFYFGANDVVWGGTGQDDFFVAGGRIKDFQPGIDKIFIDYYNTPDLATFEHDVQPYLHNTGAGVKLQWDNGTVEFVLVGVSKAELSAGDFDFY